MNSLKESREGAALSHRKAAAKLGIGVTTLLRWEKPDFDPRKLSIETVDAMAAAYGVPASRLTNQEPKHNGGDAA
jgi:transcriptional regulator with XRE-family HTH domain